MKTSTPAIDGGQGHMPVVPDIDGDRCVHSKSHLASCSACADACPHDAVVIDDDILGIDTEKCTGCARCLGVCPETAIAADFSIKPRKDMVFLSCALSPCATGSSSVPCVHVLGLEDLSGLHERGVREIVVETADCATCVNAGPGAIAGVVDQFNQLSKERGLKALRLDELDKASADRWRAAGIKKGDVDPGRRAFLRKLLPAEENEETSETEKRHLPLILLKGSENQEAQTFPFTPRISAENCVGCHACVNICPHEALIYIKEAEGANCYSVNAGKCSGCGLCSDICEYGAIDVSLMTTLAENPVRVLLAAFVCQDCGVEFVLPADKNENVDRCRICEKTGHHAKLFQVLK